MNEYKRRWLLTPKEGGGRPQTFLDSARNAARARLLDDLEGSVLHSLSHEGAVCPLPLRTLRGDAEKRGSLPAFLDWLQSSVGAAIEGDPIPFLAAHRYTDAGLEKRAAWERTWDLQRREDAGDKIANIPVPPKYDNKDFRDPNYFRLRGKLDVPKERFISYPGCESDEDREPVYGWAGWNHLQQAQALAALYQARKTEGFTAARLTPMLAGLLELLPWLKQWHNEPSAEFDGLKLGDYFEGYIDGECAGLGVTRDELRAWRPEKKVRGGGKTGAKGAGAKGRKAKKNEAAGDADDGA